MQRARERGQRAGQSARSGAELDRGRLVDPPMHMRRAAEGLPSAPTHLAGIASRCGIMQAARRERDGKM